jgi:phage portal protein BeeE
VGWVDSLAARLGFQRRDLSAQQLIAQERLGVGSTGSVMVTQDSALRHSGVWAALRLRANLMSTLPVDVYRRVGGIQVEVAKPPLLVSPGGTDWTWPEWMWATQFDLDRYGNCFGKIIEFDGLGFPRLIEPVAAGLVSVRGRGGEVTKYLIQGEEYDPPEIWHERQYRVAGSAMGLCPITYAAWSIGAGLSAQKFGLDFFASGAGPGGTLKNTALPLLSPEVVAEAKAKFKAATVDRDIFVTGRDWEWNPSDVPDAAEQFLDSQKLSVVEVARYLDVPADLIDAAVSGESVTYANISQRNLQLLVMSMGPSIVRREASLSRAIPAPRYVKLNGDALLRMDPETRTRLMIAQVAGKVRAPSEVRELDNLPPFTPEQEAEIARLLPAKTPAPAPTQQLDQKNIPWEVPV